LPDLLSGFINGDHLFVNVSTPADCFASSRTAAEQQNCCDLAEQKGSASRQR
jgi:hypothetical protein